MGDLQGYSIERELGRGGMAVVYLATQLSLRRKVALKLLERSAADDELARRFVNEAHTLAALRHRNIVTVYDVGESDSGAFMSMECLDGGSLRDRLREGITPQQSLAYLAQLGAALSAAHSQGVVHRDVKPDNVLFRDAATPVLTDFGIARRLDAVGPAITQAGMMVGTPSYISPEQILGHVTDGRSDQYSLGAMWFEMLTGHRPFEDSDSRDLLHAHLARPVPALPLALAALQPTLWRMMAKQPAERFPDLSTMLQDLGGRLLAAPELLGEVTGTGVASASERLMQLGFPTLGLRSPRGLPVTAAIARPPDAPAGPAVPPPSAGIARPRRAPGIAGAGVALGVAVLLGALLWRTTGDADDAAPPVAAPHAPATASTSIAVLPFTVPDDDDEAALFAFGIHDEVLADLARIASLTVISRNSAMRYRGSTLPLAKIADELGVSMLVDGRLTRAGGRLRLQVNLNDADANRLLWSAPFELEADAGNLFEIQSRIASDIAAQMGSRVTEQEHRAIEAPITRDTAAYALYLRGKERARYGDNTEQDILGGIALFEQAIERDPGFVAAYAAKAVGHLSLFWSGHERDLNIDAARRALNVAKGLAPDSADTLIALGYYHYWGFFEYEQAEQALARAIALAPGNAEAWASRAAVARRALRFDDAVTAYRKCIELDPLRPANLSDLALTLLLSGDLRAAQDVATRAKAAAPRSPYPLGVNVTVAIAAADLELAWRSAKDFPAIDSAAYDYMRSMLALYLRDETRLRQLIAGWPAPRDEPPFLDYFDLLQVFALRQLGDEDAARSLLARLKPRIEQALRDDPGDSDNREMIVAIHALEGDLPRLRAAHASLMQQPPADRLWLFEEGFVVVLAHALAGEAATTFELVEMAMDRYGDSQFAKVELAPAFDRLRDHPEYRRLKVRYDRWRQPQD